MGTAPPGNLNPERPALVCENVEALKISDFGVPDSNPIMVLRDTRKAWLEANRPRKEMSYIFASKGSGPSRVAEK
jgi:hypothetical protein